MVVVGTSSNIVNVISLNFDGSALLAARTVAVEGVGTVEGEVYNPSGVIVPKELPPVTCQSMGLPVGSKTPVTDAENCCVELTAISSI